MVVEGVTAKEGLEGAEDPNYFCCIEYLKSRRNSKITEHVSSFTDDRYYCVIDGFGYPILENILYCPYCGSKLVSC
jgi:hypothetical protein